jgi:hypothetical protein
MLRIGSCARFLLMLVLILHNTGLSAQQTNGDFRRGDCHVDGHVDLADVVQVIDYLFGGAAPIDCALACDANDDDTIDVQDIITITSYVVLDGTLPPPVGSCEQDPTPGTLFCDVPCDPPVVQPLSPEHRFEVMVAPPQPQSLVLSVASTSPDPLHAFSFGLCHDPSEGSVQQLDLGVDLQPNPPDFIQVVIEPGGWTAAVVMSFLNSQPFPAGSEQRVFEAQYEIDLTSPVGFTEFCPCETIGDPPLAIRMVTEDGESVWPEFDCLSLVIVDPIFFVRGDCNGDGGFNIADVVYLLDYLFIGSVVLPCEDASDIDDDGSLNIADPINYLAYLFSGGPPPAAPNPVTGCGEDVIDTDSLDCEEMNCP